MIFISPTCTVSALSLAGKLGLRNKALSINLLPMTLVKAPNAVAFLLDEISRNDLIPEQIIVEFTEREVISRMADFTDAVRKLKGAGINLAIDHFGAGFAGRCWRNTNPTELKSTMS